MDERGTAGRAGCAMSRVPWSTGDRRTDAFVVLLVVAGSIAATLIYALRLSSWGEFWPAESFAGSSGLGLLWKCLTWFTWDPGTLVPLLIGLAALLRFCGVRPAVIAVTAYLVLAGLVIAAASIAGMLEERAQGVTFAPAFWISACHRVFWALGPCIVPLAVCLAGPATAGQPKRIASRLTRVFLVVEGVASTVWGAACFVEDVGSALRKPTSSASADQALDLCTDVLSILWGAALIVCARRLVACDRISRRVIWAMATVQGVGWALGSLLATASRAATGSFPDTLVLGTDLISLGSPLVGAGVILWYWWPVLRGRVSPALDPDVPHCTRCGYNLTGNVSGVCPECGTPVPLVVPTSA